MSRESKIANSEISRILNRNTNNSHKLMVLDRSHLERLRDPKNMRNKTVYNPEGYNPDHSREYRRLAASSARSHRHDPLREPDPMRCSVAVSTLNQALAYKFRLKDLHKYSQRLHYKDINWKLKLSALGKKIPDIKQRKRILIKNSHLSTLMRLLRNTDWSQTPVYFQFLRNGRWKHEDQEIFSEIELKYNITYLNKLISTENSAEMHKDNM